MARSAPPTRTLVAARGISKSFAGVEVLSDVDLDLRRGEIHALLGENGAGKSTFARILAGVHRPTRGTLALDGRRVGVPSPLAAQRLGIAPADRGTIRVRGRDAVIAEPADAIALGLAFVPEDRALAGIFGTMSVESNVTAMVPRRIAPRGFIRRALERALARETIEALGVRLASPRRPIVELSGGNQQKAILGRWLHTDPSILILDEPTRGVDVGVTAEFHDRIRALAGQGRAILLISSELPELLALADRVLVMAEGRLTADLPRSGATQESVMHAAVPRASPGREAA